MKFLCIECDRQMTFEERELPGDGTLAVSFSCPACGRRVGMLTNPFETQLVSSLGVVIGGRTVPEQPMEMVRSTVTTGKDTAFGESPAHEPSGTGVKWSADAQERLARVPNFVRGMVKRIYAEYARDHGIVEITPALMDTARTELGLEGM
jgi:Proto-chlorophyllide reductase 57 kD subunit